MRIALIGYGKMGRLIEELSLDAGHKIVLKISSSNAADLSKENLSKSDVAIEFTSPDAAYNNVKQCIDAGVPVVCGTTGWNEKLEEMKAYCRERNGSFLHASNFSIGVNIFFEVNRFLAIRMGSGFAGLSGLGGYDVSIKEIHHTQKKDAPSGTAVTLAEQILEHNKSKTRWVKEVTSNPEELSIYSKRKDPAPGTHEVKYSSEIDDIEIIHTAHNRKGFASGAIKAAEYIVGKKGVFGMREVLGLDIERR